MCSFKEFLFSKKIFFSCLAIFVLALCAVLIFQKKSSEVKIDHLSEENFPAIKIQILNGCGFSGVANSIKLHLQEKNIDVVNISNTKKYIYDETMIVVKQIDDIDLQRLKNITGINNVIYATNESYITPFIIIAGKDYKRYFN